MEGKQIVFDEGVLNKLYGQVIFINLLQWKILLFFLYDLEEIVLVFVFQMFL